MDIYSTNWNEADASNSTAAPDGWPEGMMPSGVNDAGRAMMGATKRFVDQQIPLVTGGTSTAYTLAYAVAPSQLFDGMTHLVQFNAINGAAPTLNVNTLGAKPLHFWSTGGWGAWPANMVAVDQIVRVTYNAAAGTYRAIGMPAMLRQSASATSTIDFTGIPATVNDLEITYTLALGAANNQIQLQLYVSGVLDTSASYFAQITANNGGSVGSAGSVGSGLTAASLGTWGNTVPVSGKIWFNNIQSGGRVQGNYIAMGVDASNANLLNEWGGGGHISPTGPVTGIRILSGTTMTGPVTFAAK
jgi:hypothetical protein